MGSLLNTLLCIIHYSWANSKGQLIILLISPSLYFYNYNNSYREFLLLNIFAINLIQIVILNWSIKSNELVRFLNFNNVSDFVILSSQLLFLYFFLLVHLLLFLTISSTKVKGFFVLNLLILVYIAFRLVSWTLNRRITITTFIFLLISQIAVWLFANSNLIIVLNILLLIIILGLYRLKSDKNY
jgi:hypothetical protein